MVQKLQGSEELKYFSSVLILLSSWLGRVWRAVRGQSGWKHFLLWCGIHTAHRTDRAEQNHYVKTIPQKSSLPNQRCLYCASSEGIWSCLAIQKAVCFNVLPSASWECQRSPQRLQQEKAASHCLWSSARDWRCLKAGLRVTPRPSSCAPCSKVQLTEFLGLPPPGISGETVICGKSSIHEDWTKGCEVSEICSKHFLYVFCFPVFSFFWMRK